MRPSPPDKRVRRSQAAFTLIELLFVMAILAIGAAFVAPNMNSFFRGRVLSVEARRMLTLVHYGQSRAVAEGVPVVLWFNPRAATYGVETQPGFVAQDDLASSYTLDPALSLEAPAPSEPQVSELGDENPGLTDGLAYIRFLPSGFYDQGSAPKIILHEGSDSALELVPTADHLSYEILPFTSG